MPADDTIRFSEFSFLLCIACTVSEIIATEVQNSTFSIPHLYFSVEPGITEYYDPDRLRQANNQYTDVSCHVPTSTVCDHNPPTLQTDGQKDAQINRQPASRVKKTTTSLMAKPRMFKDEVKCKRTLKFYIG